jgi:hypothetical protein
MSSPRSRTAMPKSLAENRSDSSSAPGDSEATRPTARKLKAASKIRNPKSKIQNRKRPYVRTPARLATSHAHLDKAWTAPKELVYRPTVKRLLACRAGLLKALAVKRERSDMVGS